MAVALLLALTVGLGLVGTAEREADGYRDAVETCEAGDHNGCLVIQDEDGHWIAETK